ncbi:MAG: two-component regulator propeller domain-containing protein [Bacteroidota bacterium]
MKPVEIHANGIENSWVKSVFTDRTGNVWIGTQGRGVFRYNSREGTYTNFVTNGTSNSIAHNDILTFNEGADGKLWIGTENGGISIYDTHKNSFTTIKNLEGDNSSLSNNSVYYIFRDDHRTCGSEHIRVG